MIVLIDTNIRLYLRFLILPPNESILLFFLRTSTLECCKTIIIALLVDLVQHIIYK